MKVANPLTDIAEINLSNGIYSGTIKAYNVCVEGVNYKSKTGVRSPFPIPVYVVVKNGKGTVYESFKVGI